MYYWSLFLFLEFLLSVLEYGVHYKRVMVALLDFVLLDWLFSVEFYIFGVLGFAVFSLSCWGL